MALRRRSSHDKPWKNEELRCKEEVPPLRTGSCSMRPAASTVVGTAGLHPKLLLDLTEEGRRMSIAMLTKVEQCRVWTRTDKHHDVLIPSMSTLKGRVPCCPRSFGGGSGREHHWCKIGSQGRNLCGTLRKAIMVERKENCLGSFAGDGEVRHHSH